MVLVLALRVAAAGAGEGSSTALPLFEPSATPGILASAGMNPTAGNESCIARSRPTRLRTIGLPAIGKAVGQRSRLNLFDDKNLETEWLNVTTHSSRNQHWTGRLADDPLSAVELTQVDETFHIQVTSPRHGTFEIARQPDGNYAVREFDEEKLKGNGACFVRTATAEYGTAAPVASPTIVDYASTPQYAGYTTSTVDVLVVYTPGVLSAMGSRSAVVAKAQAGVNAENSDFSRSQIVHGLRLVHTRQINYTGSGNLATDLGWVAGSAEVAAIRNEVGADLVALMVEKDNNGTLGIAQMPGAFSANYYSTFSGVWPHEVGHNQGCSHNKEAGGPGVYAYSYAHWWNDGTREVGTVMSYRGSRIAWFSNPNVLYQGFATGVANDQDHARTINEYEPTVAASRPAKTLMDAALFIETSTSTPAERSPFDLTVTVSNLGPATATSIQASVPIPSTLSWVADTGGGSYNRASGLWTVPALAAGVGATLTITAQPNPGTRGSSLVITGAVTSVGSTFADFDYYNNSASATVVPLPDLSATFFWTNNNSGNWSGAGNWTNATPPPAGGSNVCALEFMGNGGYTASNDFLGPFSVNILELASASTNATTLAGNPLQFISASNSAPAQLNVRSAAAVTIKNPVLLTSNLTVSAPSGKLLTLAGSVGGAGDLVKNSGNKLALAASNDFTGRLLINAGNVEADHLQAFARCSGVTVAPGAHLDLKTAGAYSSVPVEVSGDGGGWGALQFNQSTISSYTWPGSITLLGDTRLGTYGVAITNNVTGPITGTGALSFYGQGGGNTHIGVFVLSNSGNAWSGDTSVDAGSSASAQIKLGANNALPVGTRLTLNAYGDASHFAHLDLNGFSQTLAGLTSDSGSNLIANSSPASAALTLNLDDDYFSAAALSGNFTLTKNGMGMLTLSGTAAQSGGTVVNGGDLAVDGVVAPGLVQIKGARLGGTGFLGTVVLTNNASLHPGFRGTPGTLSFSNLTCAAGTQLRFSLTNTLTVGGGINDFLSVSNLNCSGTTLVALNVLSPAPPAGRYVLARSANALTGTNYLGLSPEVAGTRYQPSLDLSVPREVGLLIGSSTAPQSLTWRGDGAANTWDLSVTTNWLSGAAPERFFNADSVTFNDSGSNSPGISLTGTLAPAAITVSSSNSFTFAGSGSFVGPVTLSKTGSGALALNTANSFNGGTAGISGGTVSLGNANALRGLESVSVASGAVLVPSLSGATYAAVPLTLAGTGTGRGALYFSGGTFTWPGPLSLSSNARIGAYSAGNNSYTFSGAISGAGELNFWAGGSANTHNHIFTLSGASSYQGGTSLDTYAANCFLRLSGGPNRLPPDTVLALRAGIWNSQVLTAQFELRGNNQTLGGLTTGTPILGSSGNNRVLNGSATFALLTLDHDTNFTFSGALGGSTTNDNNFGLVKDGAGTLLLSGSNTFAGPLVVAGGQIEVTNGYAIPDDCPVVLSNELNAALVLDAAETIGSLSGGGDLGGNISLNSRSLVIVQTTPGGFDGAIAGSGSVTKGGAAPLTLSGNSTFTGTLSVLTGSVVVASSGALGVGPKTISLNNGTAGQSQLHLDGSSGPVILPANISFLTSWVGGTVVNDAGTNTLLGNFNLTGGGGDTCIVVSNGTLTLAGNLTPSVSGRNLLLRGTGLGLVSGVIGDGAYPLNSVQKLDSGTWTLAGTNTYSGATLISGGTLNMLGVLPTNAVTVSGNATLAGNGTILGPVTISAGATLAPGNATLAPLTVSNRVTLQSGSATCLRLDPGSGTNDQLRGLSALGYGGTLTVTNLGGTPAAGQSFKLFSAAAYSGTFATLNLPSLPSGLTWSNRLSLDGSLVVAVTAPPYSSNPCRLTNTWVGNSLSLSWPADHRGWVLQLQTNSLSQGLGTNWVAWPGSETNTTVVIPIVSTNPAVFIRLALPTP